MKRHLLNISLLMACAGFLVACSNEDASQAEKERVNQIMTEVSTNSDVIISLSSGSSNSATTRGSIESTEKGYFESSDPFGLFMFATSCFDETTINMDNVDWTASGPGKQIWDIYYPDKWSVWDGIYNLEAMAEYKLSTDKKDTLATNMRWTDGSVRYYPYGSPFAYTFYGYHPRVSDENLERTKDYVIGTFYDLDGTKDLIWGYASKDNVLQSDSTDKYAYSARYFHFDQHRDAADPAHVADPAQMQFVHKLARLKFNIIAGGLKGEKDPYYNYDLSKSVTIDTIFVANAPDYVKLVLASMNDNYKSGELSEISSSRTKAIYLNVKDTDEVTKKVVETSFINVKPSSHMNSAGVEVADTIALNGDIMVPPISINDPDYQPYYIQIHVKTKDGKYVQMVIPMELKLAQNGGALKEGYTYNINLTIYAPENILINATLEQWKDDDGTTIVTDDEGQIRVE